MQYAAVNSLLSIEGKILHLNLSYSFTVEFSNQIQKIGMLSGGNISKNNF